MLFNKVKNESSSKKIKDTKYPSIPLMLIHASTIMLIVAIILFLILFDITNKPLSVLLILFTILSLVFTLFSFFNFRKVLFQKMQLLNQKENEYKTIIKATNLYFARYDIKTKTLYDDSNFFRNTEGNLIYKNFPDSFIKSEACAPESVEGIISFFEKVANGEKDCSTSMLLKIKNLPFRWYSLKCIMISNDRTAVFTSMDITEQNEKDTVYNKWKQSLNQRNPNSFIFFRANLSKNLSYDYSDGNLFNTDFAKKANSFDETTQFYASEYVNSNDFDKFITFFNRESLLAAYFSGDYLKSLEYREILSTDSSL